MRKLTQKLVLSVVTMALVVIALGTSTFAWFTLTNTATLQVFDAQVTAGEGIEVTLGVPNGAGNPYTEPVSTGTPTTWYTVLPTSVIESYITTRYTNDFRFSDLTSADGKTFTKYNLNNNTSSAATTGWIEIPLYFRSANQQDIVWNSAALGGTSKVWTVNVDTFKHSDGLSYGVDETNKTIRVAAWTAGRVSISGKVGIANNAAGTPVVSSVVYQQGVGPIDSVTNSLEMLESYDFNSSSPFLPNDTNNAKGAASYAIAVGKSLSLAALPTIPTTVTAVNDSVVTLVADAIPGFTGYYTGVAVVRVWIEGWDADTYDAIFSTLLTVQLGFSTKVATA